MRMYDIWHEYVINGNAIDLFPANPKANELNGNQCGLTSEKCQLPAIFSLYATDNTNNTNSIDNNNNRRNNHLCEIMRHSSLTILTFSQWLLLSLLLRHIFDGHNNLAKPKYASTYKSKYKFPQNCKL